ncbi:hypothetical protein P8452_39659 [Trifolium repens]|nr:hypothetical protein P8452_39659 [Trifolium repens]
MRIESEGWRWLHVTVASSTLKLAVLSSKLRCVLFFYRLFLSLSLLTYLITMGLNDHTTHTTAAEVSSTEV